MGTLTLPRSGTLYADANTIIYRVEAIQPYLDAAMPLWNALDAQTHNVVTSELSVLEVLVKPIQTHNVMLQKLFLGVLYATPSFTAIPITQCILTEAARLRATTGLKSPDAIHAATALSMGCILFVTNDPIFRRVPDLPVALLSEVMAGATEAGT